MATEFKVGEILPKPSTQDELEEIIDGIDGGRITCTDLERRLVYEVQRLRSVVVAAAKQLARGD